MSELHYVETSEKEKPILLLCGNTYEGRVNVKSILSELVREYQHQFKLVLVSDDIAQTSTENKDFYRVSAHSLYLLDKIVEKIDYAVIVLNSSDERKYIHHTLDKLKKDNSKVVVILPITKLTENYDVVLELKNEKNISFLILGDVFGNNSLSHTSKFIDNAVISKTVILSGNDLATVLPISVLDVITSINILLFGKIKHEKIFYLFYKHPQTVISAMHLMKRIEPDLEVKFQEQTTPLSSLSLTTIERTLAEKTHLKPVYLDKYLLGFEKSIKYLFENKTSLLTNPQTNTGTLHQKEARKRIVLPSIHVGGKHHTFFNTILLSVILFILVNISFLGIGIFFFKEGIRGIQNNKFDHASAAISRSNFFLSTANPTVTILLNAVSFHPKGAELKQEFLFLTDTVSFVNSATASLTKVNSFNKGLSAQELEQLLSTFTFLYLEAEKFKFTDKSKYVTKLVSSQNAKLLSFAHVLPKILGYETERKYLVLFQNNGELRPSGGFIGSVGELSLKESNVSELTIRDVYELDGQLTAHIEPHYIIRRYLQPHLYLRDSNFSPDFETTASYSALLYNAETKHKIDGVIAIDFEVLREIMKTTGPLYLPTYKKTVDENTAFEFLQDTIQTDFFPGSTQKKDVLQAVFNQILLKVESDPALRYKILSLLPRLLDEKHILFAFPDRATQNIFSVNSFAGNLVDLRPTETNTILDALSVNEANIGVNKANIYVSRELSYEVNLASDTEITSVATLTLTNTNSKSQDYRAFIRFLTPLGSKLSKIVINDTEQSLVPAVTDFSVYESPRFRAPGGLEVHNTVENGYQSYGFVVTVKKGSESTITVEYVNSVKPLSAAAFTYSLQFFKQSGTLPYPFTVVVHYKENYSPENIENATFQKNTIVLKKEVKKDEEIRIKLLKNQP